MSRVPLLIELGTEELPMHALPELASAFYEGILGGLRAAGIEVDDTGAKPLHSPRRLAVLLPSVALSQADQRVELLGPYLNIALDADGQPTKALQGFAAKNGIEWTALERTTDNKGERFVYRADKAGQATAALLPEIFAKAVAGMPIPKPMRWGAHAYSFSRPVHWLVALLGSEVVPMSLLGVSSDRISRGHRFMHEGDVVIAEPTQYVAALRGAHVLVDPAEREQRIVEQATRLAQKVDGQVRLEPSIVAQVVALTEWPSAVRCAFEPEFLEVPQEALIETMEANQKFFPVLDAQGRLSSHFIGTANIESRDVTQIRKGYERVIRPRFADAKFFFDEDRKQGLSSINEGLSTVTYQAKLGTVADKAARVGILAAELAPLLGVDADLAKRAAALSKADLQSRMVNEFPELQGIAGRHYALHQGEDPTVAAALDEIYMPRNAGDDIAPSRLGQVLAIADRLDTLAGGFAAGLRPTGNKDPFALRRQSLGLARTLLQGEHELLLHEWIERAVALQPIALPDDLSSYDITQFVYDRLRAYFADRGVTASQFEAVNAVPHDSLPDFAKRLQAVGEFAGMDAAPALAAANKRARNILRKVEEPIATSVREDLLTEAAERDLFSALRTAQAEVEPLLDSRDYVGVLTRLASLRPTVDAFFDGVMVNADDMDVRRNRWALLQQLSDTLGGVAALEHLSA